MSQRTWRSTARLQRDPTHRTLGPTQRRCKICGASVRALACTLHDWSRYRRCGRVSLNRTFQKSVGITDTGQPHQFDLEHEAGFEVTVAVAHEAARHRAHPPAAGTEFEPGELIQRLALLQRIDQAC